MKVAMQDVAKKLSLWHTPTFCPIMSHDDLEPIMASIGFVSVHISTRAQTISPPSPLTDWKEYVFHTAPQRGAGNSYPRLRLPSPRIDGLHLLTYKSFLCALEHYVSPTKVHNLFHVRAMPLTRLHDRAFDKAYRPMKDCNLDDEGIYVFRYGTIDQSMIEHVTTTEQGADNEDGHDHRIKGYRCHSSPIFLVPWDCLIPKRDVMTKAEQPWN
ncbi:hypothetical protein HPP92_007239 [Vanilla planifolia]|uniref:Uncharacterized protein n=1 Tax=Vanilla planifolia TaxID=51239 RepID=A0A835VBP0_VANPL|nr:hypothetical protein HPP92_007239 [Vanilla planifolia]